MTRKEVIQLRCSIEEKNAWQARADAMPMSLSEYIRFSMDDHRHSPVAVSTSIQAGGLRYPGDAEGLVNTLRHKLGPGVFGVSTDAAEKELPVIELADEADNYMPSMRECNICGKDYDGNLHTTCPYEHISNNPRRK